MADLVFASLSLPFAGDKHDSSVRRALAAVKPGGWFVGVLFGHNGTWASNPAVSSIDRGDVVTSFRVSTRSKSKGGVRRAIECRRKALVHDFRTPTIGLVETLHDHRHPLTTANTHRLQTERGIESAQVVE